MLSFLQRAVKSIVYKCACTYISRDIHFAADLVREGFKNNSVREKILEEDIKSHNGYWLGQLKNRIADHKEAAQIAEEYLISQDQYKGKVVESLYNNGQLSGFVDVYFKKDIDMLEKVFRLFSEESGFWDHTAYYRLQQRMYLELAQKILLGGVSNCRYSSEDGVLQIDGWFFPVSNYDKIVIEQSGRYLGEAVLGMKRMDVFENYPAGAEKYAGWFYQEEHQQVECGRPVMVRVYREGNLVFDTSCAIEIADHLKNDKIKSRFEEVIQIYKENHFINEINITQLKNCMLLIKSLGKKIQCEGGAGWRIERKYGNVTDIQVPMVLTTGVAGSEEMENISNLVGAIGKETGFYNDYLRNNNYKRVKADADFIKKYIALDAEILDIGAVPPLLEEFLMQSGYHNLTVWDPNAGHFSAYFRQNHICAKIINIFNLPIEEIRTEYDVVVFAEVLEHLTGNIKNALEKVSKCVRKDGFLYLTTPNLRSISGAYGLFEKGSGLASKYRDSVMQQYLRVDKNGYYGHIREYTDIEVVEIMKVFGFELIEKNMLAEFREGNVLVSVLEQLYPQYGLFGKYLFKKTADIC